LALLNLVVNVRDKLRVGDKLGILTRNIERGRAGFHRMAQASQPFVWTADLDKIIAAA
jgi:hypothetical protein